MFIEIFLASKLYFRVRVNFSSWQIKTLVNHFNTISTNPDQCELKRLCVITELDADRIKVFFIIFDIFFFLSIVYLKRF